MRSRRSTQASSPIGRQTATSNSHCSIYNQDLKSPAARLAGIGFAAQGSRMLNGGAGSNFRRAAGDGSARAGRECGTLSISHLWPSRNAAASASTSGGFKRSNISPSPRCVLRTAIASTRNIDIPARPGTLTRISTKTRRRQQVEADSTKAPLMLISRSVPWPEVPLGPINVTTHRAGRRIPQRCSMVMIRNVSQCLPTP